MLAFRSVCLARRVVRFRAGLESGSAEGFSVALVARNEDKLQSGVQDLKSKGITESAFPADLSDPASIAKLVTAVRSELGPISVIHWNECLR